MTIDNVTKETYCGKDFSSHFSAVSSTMFDISASQTRLTNRYFAFFASFELPISQWPSVQQKQLTSLPMPTKAKRAN